MAARKKTGIKKNASKKKAAKKKAVKKQAGKGKTAAGKRASTRKRASIPRPAMLKQEISVEPGPPPGSVPPVEEPTSPEMAVGVVTHYYSHLGVAVIQVNTGVLRTGDMIHVKGHTTDFTQQIASMEYEHQHVDQAIPGQSVGIKAFDHAREHDIVYVVK